MISAVKNLEEKPPPQNQQSTSMVCVESESDPKTRQIRYTSNFWRQQRLSSIEKMTSKTLIIDRLSTISRQCRQSIHNVLHSHHQLIILVFTVVTIFLLSLVIHLANDLHITKQAQQQQRPTITSSPLKCETCLIAVSKALLALDNNLNPCANYERQQHQNGYADSSIVKKDPETVDKITADGTDNEQRSIFRPVIHQINIIDSQKDPNKRIIKVFYDRCVAEYSIELIVEPSTSKEVIQVKMKGCYLMKNTRNQQLPLLEGPPSDALPLEISDENATEYTITYETYLKDYVNIMLFGPYDNGDTGNSFVSQLVPLQRKQLTANKLIEHIRGHISTKDSRGESNIDELKQIILKEPSHLTLLSEQIALTVIFITSLAIGLSVIFFLSRKKPERTISDGPIREIGKISFDPRLVIGRGSAGTCIFKGLYEKTQHIAVKRVIGDCFTLAEREIDLLRSLQHENLIRYFATESDEIFKYIAVELAEFSLADMVQNLSIDNELDAFDVLYQSSKGVEHLHKLNIIHRDIKPQNILISCRRQPLGKRKVMISDFGVSKQIDDCTSISGEFVSTTNIVRGTEGWIAPEVITNKLNLVEKDQNQSIRATKPIDIFSLGCVFYYVMTNGKHPFGGPLERQGNILKGTYSLSELSSEENLIKTNLIESMVSFDMKSRPTIETVLKHPIFWSASRQLQFLQDVSDRIESEKIDSEIVRSLEFGGLDVVKGDWRRHITEDLQTDLRKFRSYKGNSVKDLLRALRNKRHHYRELSEELQRSLGSIPDQFVAYFTSRFPRLVIHSYIAMQSYYNEDIFQTYYNQDTPWDFSFSSLPRSEIRWFNQIRCAGKKFEPNDDEISLRPNGGLSATFKAT